MDLEFDDFGSELPIAATRPTAVTLADLLATSTPMHWDEAVAVLQELLALVTSMRRDDIPAFEDVVIDPGGTLMIRSLRHGERGPLAAGRALHALLATADVPVALRLFVTQANAPETHRSLDAFAKALTYFGKSDRAELIRAAYGRYKPSATPTATQRPVLASVPPRARPPALPETSQPLAAPRSLQNGLVVAAAVVGLVSVAAIAWLFFGHSTQAATTSETAPVEATTASSTPTPTAARAGTKAAAPAAARSAHPVDTTLAHAATTGAPAAAAVPKARDVRAVTTPAPGLNSSHARAPQSNRASTSADLAFDVAAAEPARIASLAGALAPASGSISTVITSQQAALASAVYSRDDVDVQPPVMLYPQLPPQLFVGSPSEGLENRMEIVVAPDGTVERVRLTRAPRRMADMMLLSGAKLWRFAPAVKDGVPVRYRTTITWTVFP